MNEIKKQNKPKLPRILQVAKNEFEKNMRRYWHNREQNEENTLILYIQLNEFHKFIEKTLLKLGQNIFLDMKDKDEFVQYLSEYGKKVFYDEDANWLNIDDMTTEDYVITSKRNNAKKLGLRK